MITYRTGAAGAPATAKSMAAYLAEVDVPELQAIMAKYYAAGMDAAENIDGVTMAMPRRDMHPLIAERLGIDPNRNMRTEEVAGILAGLRADGQPIEGRQAWAGTKTKARLSFVDLVFSPDKTVSISIALAENRAERAVVDGCHSEAVDLTMAHIAKELGFARRGRGGKDGADPAHIAYVRFEHYTARPVAKIPHVADGVQETEFVTVSGLGAGDMQRHTHTIIPTTLVTDDGHVGSIDLDLLKNRLHEWDGIYHAYLATGLRRAGVDARLNPDVGSACIPAIPAHVAKAFSKRTWDGDADARRYAQTHGLDWDNLALPEKRVLLKGGTTRQRNAKNDGAHDLASWHQQAASIGYQHKSVLHPERAESVPARDVQIPMAWAAGKPMLATEFYRRAKLEGHVLRTMAARSLIASGITSPKDVDRVTKAFRDYGVEYAGETVPLIWAREDGHRWSSVTTGLHVEQENEAIGLLRKAAADRSSDLSPHAIQQAVDTFLERRPDLSFDTEHGKSQREMIERLGRSGRASMGVAAAGAGKSTAIEPLVDAWKRDERTIYGVTLAWRQTHELFKAGIGRKRPKRDRRGRVEPDTGVLEECGITKDRTLALARFLRDAVAGKLDLTRKTVVVIDEAATIGTRQLLEITRLQDEHGFQIVGLADDKQTQAIEHGATVRMFRKSLGVEQVPEIATTVRQETERDRVTATLFREGRAEEALARKLEDDTLLIVPGNVEHAIKATVDLWEQRLAANAADLKGRVGISVPTNGDVRAVGEEVRRRRRARGEVGPDVRTVAAQDQRGDEYALPLAIGDRVRLFNRVYGAGGSGGGAFGENGTVAEITALEDEGPTLRRLDTGRVALIRWNDLRNQSSERIRLTYGDALTIDTRQGDTVTDHILLMPSGSQAVNGFKGYTGDSRHRRVGYIVTSQGAEKQEVEGRRPLGDPREITDAHIVANIARNLARQPEKVLATDFLERAEHFRRGTVRNMQAADFRTETRRAQGKSSTNAGDRASTREDEAAMQGAAAAVRKTLLRIAGPQKRIAADTRKAMLERRQARRGPERPKDTPKPESRPTVQRKPISEVDAQAEFADALTRAGFRLRGAPNMDGKMHRAPVEGDRGLKKSGSYVGFLEGTVPAGYIHNFKTGEEVRWKASASTAPLSDADRAKLAAEVERLRQARESERRLREEATALRAARAWARAKPVRTHPYLARKDVTSHGLRQDRDGKLLVPMRDAAGKLWNIQSIAPDGKKLFMAGRKHGLFTILGEIKPGEPISISEGYATTATMREMSGLTSIVAFDSGNLLEVAKAVRGVAPDALVIFAADNDHHLPRRDPPLPNVGREKAEAASAAVGGVVLLPEFAVDDKGTDWNDFAALSSRAVVREIVAAEIAKHGIALPPPLDRHNAMDRPSATQARRDDTRKNIRSSTNAAAAQTAVEAFRQEQRPKGPVA